MIKAFIMDVDGTLTDGKIYMGSEGEIFKAFDIKDGYGIHEILPAYGIKTIIMTGRSSQIVKNRAKELEIDYVLQNVKDKKGEVMRLAKELGCLPDEFAYIGDDIMDLPAMKVCGLRGCPSDAVDPVKEVSDFVASHKGGNGAVRDFIEWICKEENRS